MTQARPSRAQPPKGTGRGDLGSVLYPDLSGSLDGAAVGAIPTPGRWRRGPRFGYVGRASGADYRGSRVGFLGEIKDGACGADGLGHAWTWRRGRRTADDVSAGFVNRRRIAAQR